MWCRRFTGFGTGKGRRAELILKLGSVLFALLAFAHGHAAPTVVASSDEVAALEVCTLFPWLDYQEGITTSGIAFRVNRIYSERYTSITISFERPMAGIGAWTFTSGGLLPADSAERQIVELGTPSVDASRGGYFGLVANDEGFTSATFLSSGTLEISRLELRPMPVAQPDDLVVDAGQTLVLSPFALLGNDTFVEGARLVSGPSNAQIFSLRPDGAVTYQPSAGFSGIDTFTYVGTNGGGAANSQTVEVQILVRKVSEAAQEIVETTSDEQLELADASEAPTLGSIDDAFIEPGEPVVRLARAAGGTGSKTFELIEGPKDALLDPNSGVFIWEGSAKHPNSTQRVSIRCTDEAGLSTDISFAIAVSEFAGLLTPIEQPILRTAPGTPIRFNLPTTASDATYHLGNSVSGASITTNGTFEWVPPPGDAGKRRRFLISILSEDDVRVVELICEVEAPVVAKRPPARESKGTAAMPLRNTSR